MKSLWPDDIWEGKLPQHEQADAAIAQALNVAEIRQTAISTRSIDADSSKTEALCSKIVTLCDLVDKQAEVLRAARRILIEGGVTAMDTAPVLAQIDQVLGEKG